MTFIGLAVATGVGIINSNKAAAEQENVAERSANLQKEQFERQTELQDPFRQAGLASKDRLITLLGLSPNTGQTDFGKYTGDFSMKDFQTDPGYQFRLSEGIKGLENSAAARGGLLSGSVLKGIQRYGQDNASQEYQKAFDRYQVNRANQLNPLQSLIGQGQTAATTLGSAGSQYAQNAGEAYQTGANARASGYVGSANALTGGIGSYLSYMQNKDLLSRIGG